MNNTLPASSEILIVDDDPSVVMSLYQVMSDIGRVRFAETAEQTFSMISEKHPDLILLDIELPDANGLDVCTKLKAMPSTQDIPVLVITSHADVGFEESVFEVGAGDYIHKPLNPRVLAARAKTHLAYYHALKLLDKQARTDQLTKLANRWVFDDQLTSELGRANRQKNPISLIMLDIDNFKAFNDQFGHIEGDKCLQAVSTVFSDAILRSGDLVARYGGEEFAVLLPETDALGVQKVAERIRANVEALAIPHADDATFPVVTVSVGCCTSATGSVIDAASALQIADQALYQSKHEGKNCVNFLLVE
ncbi:diguanylate cyclase domain-containing protein [Reinekea blandensis]|uniref:diguanylate cyclase n=1 Tax=Reinekea blandensis MED297 TaxID=314283 RepID=A4BAZ9_9GAMM|nr:diguanylate cyclase [Reinekea blandensis]EAR10612.1 GGDEF [Reinekea sp. MED297] [Reinekea blandensis MED297]